MCFQVREEKVKESFGGSANAYLLMYRQRSEKNEGFSCIPKHVLSRMWSLKEQEKQEEEEKHVRKVNIDPDRDMDTSENTITIPRCGKQLCLSFRCCR
jgi:hypothetical protein